jgi:hypothetical protein
MMDDLRLLTVADVAERFDVAERTARGWCDRGLFPHAVQGPKTGRGAIWLIPESDLENFERPKVGYPKGRPRDLDAGDSDQEVTR